MFRFSSALRLFLPVLIVGCRAVADSTVVFNEIMYHPSTNEAALEWVELHNQMAVNMDVSGWSLQGGVQFEFAEGTVVPGGGYVVVAVLPTVLAAATGYTNAFGPFVGRLSNSGERLELRNNNQRLMDWVEYGTDGDWPVGPDGGGVSLAKINPNAASPPATNWAMSAQMGGTPGTRNFPGLDATITNTVLVRIDDVWRDENSGNDLGTAWRGAAFDDNAWPAGRALFYAGNAPPPSGEFQSIATLFNTGVDENHNALSPGVPDPHYLLTVSAQSTPPPPAIPATVIQNHPAWLANDSLSSWIGPVNPGTADVAPGEYRYRTTFDLTGFELSTAQILLSVAGDNRVNNVLINGVNTGIAFAGFTGFSPNYTLNSGFVAGTNTLEFVAVNDATTPNPAGFRAKPSGTAQAFLPRNTLIHPVPLTTYFRTTFVFNGDPAGTSLGLRALIDDGAVFYLNGSEILRLNMPGGAIASFTPASLDVTNPALRGPFSISGLLARTNVLAVEVHQSAVGTNDLLFGAELLASPATPVKPTLAFNEVAASTNSVFWVELANSGTNDISLDDYVLLRDGATDNRFVFPSGYTISAGGFLSLNETRLGFRPQSGDKLFLFPPNGSYIIDAVVVKKTLRGRFPDAAGRWLYPAQPTPGGPNVFAFHDEIVINEIMYHPRGLPATPAAYQETTLLPVSATWKYDQSGQDLGAAWRASDYDDSGWPSGPALLYVEDAALPAPKNTPLTLGRTTYYFRTQFVFNGSTDGQVLQLHPMVDDGAVFYLNGQEVFRENLPAGPVSYSTLASPGVSDATFTGPFPIPTANLVNGTNVLAVEVHQGSTNSTDIVFGTELLARVDTSPALPYRDSPEAWLELYNRSAKTADLSGWELDKGINFAFPPGTTMAPGSYLVVTGDTNYLRSLYPSTSIIGNFTNKLSRHSDLIALKDGYKNPVNEVRYYDAGRWPGYADGGGSSLELRNPFADNTEPEAWAASDESVKSHWNTFTYRGVATADGGPTRWNEFVLGLLNSGEVLLDDISVIESPGSAPRELLQNGSFENGAAAWRIIGNHHGNVMMDPDNPANHVLHLVATGPAEHMHNHAETTLANGATIANGREYQISFRAKWLAGSNQLHTRLYFNRLAKLTLLDVPGFNGTPGAQNSRFESNIGPTFSALQHRPVVPAANQPVTVSVKATDPDAVTACVLWWSANGGAWNNAGMSPAATGCFEAIIPGFAAATVVQFYVQATDSLGAESTFPASGRNSRALYKVKDGQAISGRLHNLRLIMTAADAAALHAATNVMSNGELGATVVYDEQEVFYDVGVHLQSSERGRADPSRVGFTLTFHPDELFRGVHDSITVDRSGGYSGIGGDQDEIVLKHAINHAGGLPGMYDDLVRFIAPLNQHTGPGLLLMAKYGDEFLDTQYPGGGDGKEFKLELIYYPTTTTDGNPQSPKLPQPDDVIGTDIQNRGDNQEAYRWNFLIENNRDADDYGPMISLAKAFSLSGSTLDAETQRLTDVDEWMRVFAMKSLSGDVDTYGQGYPHNLVLYFRPEDGKALALLWDMDFSWTRAVNASLYGSANIAKVIALPNNRRQFYAHLNDLITSTFNTSYMSPWTAHYAGLVNQNYGGVLSYIGQRASYVRSQFPAQVAFAITTNGGQSFMVDSTSTTLNGTAWLNVRRIVIEGRPEPVQFNWPTLTSWQATVPLILGSNRLVFLAYDFQSNLIASNAVTVTSTAVGGGLDSDGDGMPDFWETANGLIPFSNDTNDDYDGDGSSNLQEYLAGTNPLDARSYLSLDVARAADGVHLRFGAVAGRSYSVQYRDVVQGDPWNRLTDIAPQAADHAVEVVDPVTGGTGTRFYRLMTPRAP